MSRAKGVAAAKARGVKYGRPPRKGLTDFTNVRAAGVAIKSLRAKLLEIWAFCTDAT